MWLIEAQKACSSGPLGGNLTHLVRYRRSLRQLLVGPLVATSVALAATPSTHAAVPPPLPVRISYAGDQACGSEGEFREAVRRRAPELEDAGEHQAARDFI